VRRRRLLKLALRRLANSVAKLILGRDRPVVRGVNYECEGGPGAGAAFGQYVISGVLFPSSLLSFTLLLHDFLFRNGKKYAELSRFLGILAYKSGWLNGNIEHP
jgi:hypothetical protein